MMLRASLPRFEPIRADTPIVIARNGTSSTLLMDAHDPEFAGRMERVQQQVLAERAERGTSQN